MVTETGQCVVAGSAQDARRALACLANTVVDVILLDLEMPGTSGLAALPDLIAAGRGAKVMIVSSSCDTGAAATIQALALGAADTLVKPGAGQVPGRFAEILVEKIVRLSEPQATVLPFVPGCGATGDDFDLVAIGASTGGIHALSHLLQEIPADFRRPILITQHLPAAFIPYFAAQMAVVAGRPSDVAVNHMRIRPGRIIIAPGDAHIVVVPLPNGEAAIRLSQVPAATGCLPSVDPMFASLAQTHGERLLAIVLTGMGRDGSVGAQAVRAAGGTIVVQDQASSVVWGMPGAVAAAGLANAILAPEAIGALIARSRRPA